jgi:hypothetical protein
VHLGGENPDRLTSPLDFTVVRPSGKRLAGTAATPMHLEEVMRRWHVTGEHGGGSYIVIPDLVVLSRPSLECLREAVISLIAEEDLEGHLTWLDDSTTDIRH